MTFKDGSPRRFGEPSNYVGTSMAAAHVAGVAAMVLASGTIDPKAKSKGKVGAVTQRLRHTARDLGPAAERQGARPDRRRPGDRAACLTLERRGRSCGR